MIIIVKAKQSEIIYTHFTVFDSDGVTPLTGQAGSCTSSLRKNGATTAESVTIAEIGSTGYYYASFTPLAIASYDLEVTCPDDRVIGESYETEASDLDDIVTEVNAVADDVWDESKAGHTGDLKTIADNIDQSLSTTESNIRGGSDTLDSLSDQLDTAQADLDNPNQYKADVSALALEATAQSIKAKTDNLPSDPADQSLLESAISTAESNIRGSDNDDLKVISDQIDAIPTTPVGDIADAVWDEALADHLNAGSTGEALDDADAVADVNAIADAVWDEDLNDHLGGSKAGQIVSKLLKRCGRGARVVGKGLSDEEIKKLEKKLEEIIDKISDIKDSIERVIKDLDSKLSFENINEKLDDITEKSEKYDENRINLINYFDNNYLTSLNNLKENLCKEFDFLSKIILKSVSDEIIESVLNDNQE